MLEKKAYLNLSTDCDAKQPGPEFRLASNVPSGTPYCNGGELGMGKMDSAHSKASAKFADVVGSRNGFMNTLCANRLILIACFVLAATPIYTWCLVAFVAPRNGAFQEPSANGLSALTVYDCTFSTPSGRLENWTATCTTRVHFYNRIGFSEECQFGTINPEYLIAFRTSPNCTTRYERLPDKFQLVVSWRKSREVLSGFLFFCFLQGVYVVLTVLCLKAWLKFHQFRQYTRQADGHGMELIADGHKATKSFVLRLTSTCVVVTFAAFIALFPGPAFAPFLVALMLLFTTLANILYMVLFRAEMKKVTDL